MFYIGDAKVVVVYLETSYNFYQVTDLLFKKYGSHMIVCDPSVPGTGQNEKQYADWFCASADTYRNVTDETDKWVYKPVFDVVQEFENARNK